MNERVYDLTEAEGEKTLKAITESGEGYSHEPEMEQLISDTVARAHGSLDK